MPHKLHKIKRLINLEACLWVVALAFPLFIDPAEPGHFSFCIFRFLGLETCPGCGLGRSLANLYRGDLMASFKAHPLGPAALLILTYRIAKLFFQSYRIAKIDIGGIHGQHI